MQQEQQQQEIQAIIEALEERLASHDENRKNIQDKLKEFCDGLRKQIDEMEERVNGEFEEKFTEEECRLQGVLSDIRGLTAEDNRSDINEAYYYFNP